MLGLVFTRPDRAFHLREVVRLTGAGLGPVQRELRELTAAGILSRERRGPLTIYRANPASPVFEELKSLVTKTVGVADPLRAALVTLGARVRCAFVFGSFASGHFSEDSDLGVMVIGDVSFAELAKALRPVSERLGRDVNPTVYSVTEVRWKLSKGHHFVRSVVSGPKLFVAGSDDELRRVAGKRLAAAAQVQPE